MDAFGVVVSRIIPTISAGTGVGSQPPNASFSGLFSSAAVRSERISRASRKSLKLARPSNFVFSDESYLDYYSSGRKVRCGTCKGKIKEEKGMKKRQKMLKGLSRDLALLAEMGSDPDNALVDPVKAKMISEAAEFLQVELQKLWSEGKELKPRKEDQSRHKETLMQNMPGCETSSSSSSSESSDSDSDCEAVMDMNLLDCRPKTKQIPDASQAIPENEASTRQELLACIQSPQVKSVHQRSADAEEIKFATGMEIPCYPAGVPDPAQGISQKRSIDTISLNGSKTTPATKKIEVCIGGKCKKSGALALMEGFCRALAGNEAAVSGCKCMGKCRDGPNVRISNNFDEEGMHDHAKLPAPAANQLCIGVGLEDVDLIVDNFVRSQTKFGLAASS